MPLILPNEIANGLPADGDKLQQNYATIQDYINQEVINRDGSVAMQQPLLLPGAPTQPNQAATKAYVDAVGLVGEIKMWGGDNEPTNWMFCRGQAVSRATYATLFGVLGTKYGAGDGSTTFTLPSLAGRMPIGMYPGGGWANAMGQTGGSQNAALVAHNHTFGANSGTVSADHTHGGGTAIENAQHDHTINWGEVFHASANPVDNVNVFDVRIGDGYTTRMEKFPSWSYPSGAENQNHAHGFNTGGISANHTHSVNGTTSTAGSADPSLNNLPPFTTVNFIIKVL